MDIIKNQLAGACYSGILNTEELFVLSKKLKIGGVESDYYFLIDRFVGLSILQNSNYEPLTTEVFISLIKDMKYPDSFLDIGAHWGYYSFIYAHLAKDCPIYAFEPMPINFSILQKNLSPFSSVYLHECAISNQTRKGALYCDASNTGHNAIVPQNPAYENDRTKQTPIECDISNIDRFNIDFDKIKIVKIDTEETDEEVLKEVSKHLKQNTIVIYEASEHKLPEWTKDEFLIVDIPRDKIEEDKFVLKKR